MLQATMHGALAACRPDCRVQRPLAARFLSCEGGSRKDGVRTRCTRRQPGCAACAAASDGLKTAYSCAGRRTKRWRPQSGGSGKPCSPLPPHLFISTVISAPSTLRTALWARRCSNKKCVFGAFRVGSDLWAWQALFGVSRDPDNRQTDGYMSLSSPVGHGCSAVAAQPAAASLSFSAQFQFQRTCRPARRT